jgi:hypothetical protein
MTKKALVTLVVKQLVGPVIIVTAAVVLSKIVDAKLNASSIES